MVLYIHYGCLIYCKLQTCQVSHHSSPFLGYRWYLDWCGSYSSTTPGEVLWLVQQSDALFIFPRNTVRWFLVHHLLVFYYVCAFHYFLDSLWNWWKHPLQDKVVNCQGFSLLLRCFFSFPKILADQSVITLLFPVLLN